MKMDSMLHIGTSGWHYDHWKGPFYPMDLPKADWLRFYAARLSTVEINNTFYHLPEPGSFQGWRDSSPDGFKFAVKASRLITHYKKLKGADEAVGNFMQRLSSLGDKLGPILFQLPPRWHLNPDRLNNFIVNLPKGQGYAFEFRDPSWFDPAIYKILSMHQAAFCIYELSGRLSPKQVTADWIYVRLHGPGVKYQGNYDSRALSGWMDTFAAWLREGKEIYCYFDNDPAGYAVQNALTLQAIAQDRFGSLTMEGDI